MWSERGVDHGNRLGDDPIIEFAAADDGARIACKRKPHPGGIPVIFIHGLAVNADIWDIPDHDQAGVAFRSLSTVLHERGYDVWLMNLRGHGAPLMHSEPPPDLEDWCVDHFIAYDLPAVVDHVGKATGRRPWVIGNSMGAMITSGYLQGARITGKPSALRVEVSDELAQDRQDAIRGCVLLEFPAALRWPDALYDERGAVCWSEVFREFSGPASANYMFEFLARLRWLEALVRATGQVELRWLRPRDNPAAWRAALPVPLRETVEHVDVATRRAIGAFVRRFRGTRHFDFNLFANGLLRSADHFKFGVLEQLGKSVRARGFVSGLGPPDYVYSDHYDRVGSPVLLLLGGRDRIANADVTREVFFEQVRSDDKTIHVFDDIAHGDFEYAPVSYQQVYPLICDWLRRRDVTDADG